MQEKQVYELVDSLRAGKVSRRDFLKRAALLLGGATAANAMLLAATGAPIVKVAEAAGVLQGTAPATMPATMAATSQALAIKTELVTFKGSDDAASGYLAQPIDKGNYPGVVVIQEWWGLDDHIKSVTERFAKLGYVALAPDLYRGQVAKEPSDAQRLIITVQVPKALQDIQGAVDYLNGLDAVLPKKVGVIGFCFGGGLAMLMAYKGKGVGAVASFYGESVKPSDDDIKVVTVPVLGIYGELDGGSPASLIDGWAAKFKAAGKINQMIIYKGAQHAFFNDTRPSSYNEEAAKDAWQRVQDWFKQYLSDNEPVATMAATRQ